MEVFVRDIPRLYTAIAEWSACFMTICLVRKRIQGAKLYFSAAVMLFVQIFFMVVTESLNSNVLWLLCMMGAVGLMFGFLWICCDV